MNWKGTAGYDGQTGQAGRDEERVMTTMWGYGWGWGAWFAMSVMMIVFWGLVIAGIVVLVRSLGGTRQDHRPGPDGGRTSAEELLAERFARGEIDEDEYTRRLQVLSSAARTRGSGG